MIWTRRWPPVYPPFSEDGALLLYAYLDTIDLIDPETRSDDDWHRWVILWEERPHFRLQFSGVEALKFFARSSGFSELDPGRAASVLERRRRLEQLREFFKRTPVPVIQIDIGPDLGPIFRQLVPTRWYAMLLTPTIVSDEPTALVADNDIGEDDRRYRLDWIDQVEGERVRELRNVFSLAHVPDLGDDDDGDGELEPINPVPGDGCVIVFPGNGPRSGTREDAHVQERGYEVPETASVPQRLVERN